jgi:hypothetical protein
LVQLLGKLVCALSRRAAFVDAAARENASIGLQIVGIAIDNAANVTELSQIGTNWLSGPHCRKLGDQPDAHAGNPSGVLPFSVTVDGGGRLRQRKLGAYSAQELRSDLAALLR